MLSRRKIHQLKTFAAPHNLVFMGCLAVLGTIAISIVGVNIYQRLNATGPYREEYEGRVVDKSVTIRETEVGSRAVKRLLIRHTNGTQFDVIVDEALYGRAEVGMWIKRNKTMTDLSWTAPEHPTDRRILPPNE